MKAIVNKQATFNYEILDKFEAGIVLRGYEAKVIKSGQANLKGSYITVKRDPKSELWLMKAHVSKYKYAGTLPNYDPERPRKLLINKKEMKSLVGKLEQKGLTIVPLRMYTIRNLVKVQFALAKGKKQYQKKADLKKKDVDREIRRTLKYQ